MAYALMMYQVRHLDNKQHMTINADGEIIHLSRQELATTQSTKDDPKLAIARFNKDDFINYFKLRDNTKIHL